ncbi:MAG: hypothetical protein ACD_7C00210G0001 [uncultured bacterium]|nr:MAG: hypothetical protein ACD_7C00210G0001 [uncultured bacterium]
MILILIALTLTFPILYKYSFVITNQFSQIPLILSFMDKNYLINDWYVSVNRSFGPRTVFAWYMTQTAKMSSLPVTFLLHYLLYIFLVTLATYKLTFIVFKQKYISLTTTICILFGTTISLGGNILITQDFVAPQLPLGLSLLAIVFLLEKKYLLASIVFSVTSYLHPLIGFESALLFIFITMIGFYLSRKSIKQLTIYGLLPYLFFSLPAIILYLKEGTASSVSSLTKIAIHAFMRNPHHYIASSFPLSHYLQFFIMLTLFTTSLLILNKFIIRFIRNFFGVSILLILLICFMGFVGTEIFPFYPLVILQTFRLTLYIYWMAAIVVIGGIFFIAAKNSRFLPLIFIPVFLTNPSYFSSFNKVKILSTIIGFFLIVFYKKIPKYIFIFLLIIFFALGKYHDKFNFSSYYTHPTTEIEIANWTRNHTPLDSIFLIPPEFESFRLVANRAVVADWKSFPFQEKGMLEWANRMCNLANKQNCIYKKITYNNIASGYRENTKESLMELSKKYGFSYVISDKEIIGLEKIYGNKFNIYLIPNKK